MERSCKRSVRELGMLIPTKKLTEESRFDRLYACSWINHSGTAKRKRSNRQKMRRIVKSGKLD